MTRLNSEVLVKRRKVLFALSVMAGLAFMPQVFAQTATPQPAPTATAQPDPPEPIGNVATVQGAATVTRNNAINTLKVQDDIYKDDVLVTAGSSTLGITFNDETTFNLTANSRIVIDKFVYEDGAKNNAAVFNVARGTVAFVAAAVAKTGDMKISTPTATLGIRGTTGLVEVPEGASATNPNNVGIKLYPDQDGKVLRFAAARGDVSARYPCKSRRNKSRAIRESYGKFMPRKAPAAGSCSNSARCGSNAAHNSVSRDNNGNLGCRNKTACRRVRPDCRSSNPDSKRRQDCSGRLRRNLRERPAYKILNSAAHRVCRSSRGSPLRLQERNRAAIDSRLHTGVG